MSKQFLYTVRTEYPTPDGRVFVVPHGDLLYMEGNPLYDALVIEARTGARLRDGRDPVWFIRLYNKFKSLPSDGVDFREYAAKLFPHDVDYQGKTEQKTVSDIDAISTEVEQLQNFIRDVDVWYARKAQHIGPPYYLPADARLADQHRCFRREDAKEVGFEREYDLAVKRDAAYVRQLDADAEALAAAGKALAPILEKIDENSTKLLEICQGPAGMGWIFGQSEWYTVRLQISRAIAALMAREAIPREPTPPAVEATPDGPQPPNLLRHNDKAIKVEPLPWRLLNYLWNQPGKLANKQDAIIEVWGNEDTSDNAVNKAQGKVNKALSDADYSLSVSQKNGHFVID